MGVKESFGGGGGGQGRYSLPMAAGCVLRARQRMAVIVEYCVNCLHQLQWHGEFIMKEFWKKEKHVPYDFSSLGKS